jgi:hypothetical protein
VAILMRCPKAPRARLITQRAKGTARTDGMPHGTPLVARRAQSAGRRPAGEVDLVSQGSGSRQSPRGQILLLRQATIGTNAGQAKRMGYSRPGLPLPVRAVPPQ